MTGESGPAGNLPHVVIVGGGFGGLAAARALRRAPVRVTLIDRTNHHLFQPLLYQVATGVLSAVEIAAPIRHLLRTQANVTVLMTEVRGVDAANRVVSVDEPAPGTGGLRYDFLILATGASGSYFGHDEWAKVAPYPKTVADVLKMRDKILKLFELAELESDPGRHRDLLSFVLVGAGPTGVEMAGALATMTRTALEKEYRRVDLASARIILVDAGPRILAAYSEPLARETQRYLERMGVEVRTKARVERVDEDGVMVNGERIRSRCVFWTAGVRASPAGTWLGAPTDHAGRVNVLPDLTVPGHSEIFVVGDTASIQHEGHPLPGVAQVAIQSGHHAGQAIARAVAGQSARASFHYLDKGNLATVSKTFAIFEKGRWRLSGVLAKFIWAFVHILYLSGFENRSVVLLAWTWAILTRRGRARVIEDPSYAPLESGNSPTHSTSAASASTTKVP
jgi:NADH dehydrogenase FAD-containing subunit